MDMYEKKSLSSERSKHGYRPVVYICSPYRGDVMANTEKAQKYCALAVKKRAIPYAPHLLFPQFMDEGTEKKRDLALFMGRVMLDKCAEVWVFGDEISEGMRGELERAENRSKTVRYFTVDGKEKKDNE